MPSFDAKRGLAIALIAGVLGGCASTPQDVAYRDRLENHFLTQEDVQRFKTTEQEQLALVAAERDAEQQYAQATDLQLMKVVPVGSVADVKILLGRGAQVNAVDQWGNTALFIAAREGEVEIVRTLLKAGADVDGRGGAMTPLAAAALRGNVAVARLLIRSGANVNAVGSNGLTALMNAVKLNRLDVAKELLEARAGTDVLDRMGANVLAVAVDENYPDMLALLLNHGVKPDMADSNGLTPLYWADYLERADLSQLLRSAGADPARKKTERFVSLPYTLGEF